MKKKYLFLLPLCAFSLYSAEPETLYFNGFESPEDLPVRYFHFDWWEGWKNRITTHFMGPDRAPLLTGYDLGKKSFKIDFTFNQPGKTMHLFLKPEKDFRITDPMTQSAYLKIVNSSNLKVEAGAYVVYGATHIPGKQASVGHWSREKAFIPAAVSKVA